MLRAAVNMWFLSLKMYLNRRSRYVLKYSCDCSKLFADLITLVF